MIRMLQVDNWLHHAFKWSHLHQVKRKPSSQCVDQGCLSMTLRAFKTWKYSEAEWVFANCYQAPWLRQKSIHRYLEWTSNLPWKVLNMYQYHRIFVLLTRTHETMTLQEPLSTMVGKWSEVFVVYISPEYGFVTIRPYGSLNARCNEDVLKLLAHKKAEKKLKCNLTRKVWHPEFFIYIYCQVSQAKQPDSSWLAVGGTQQRLWNAGVRRESPGKWTWPAGYSTILQEKMYRLCMVAWK